MISTSPTKSSTLQQSFRLFTVSRTTGFHPRHAPDRVVTLAVVVYLSFIKGGHVASVIFRRAEQYVPAQKTNQRLIRICKGESEHGPTSVHALLFLVRYSWHKTLLRFADPISHWL